MPFAARLRAKTYVLVTLIVLFGSAGNLLLSRGMKQIGEVRIWSVVSLAGFFKSIFSNGWIWGGICGLLLFLGCFMVVLSWADYSYVSPAAATVYAVVPLVGHLLLGEKVAPLRWVGIFIIGMGVCLVGQTAPSTTRQE